MMKEIKSRLDAMRRQELHYKCCDYTRPPLQRDLASESACSKTSPKIGSSDIVHLWLDECAALVTDPSTRAVCKHGRSPVTSSPSTPELDHCSPTSVDKFPVCDGSSIAFASNSTDLACWRLQMFDWTCRVLDGFGLGRSETLATAINLLDRYTACEMVRKDSPPITREDYQIFAMTALYIAVKVLQPFPRKLGLETLSAMSRDFYTQQDLASTEIDMLAALHWRIAPPTALAFCGELALCLFPNNSCQDIVQAYTTMCEMTLSDPTFLEYPSSLTAVAIVIHAAKFTGVPARERMTLRKQAFAVLGFQEEQLADYETLYAKIKWFYS